MSDPVRRRSFGSTCVLVALLAGGGMTQRVTAAPIFWNGGASGSFQFAGNWGGVVPGPEDSALFVSNFTNALDVTVTFAGDVTTLSLDVGSVNNDNLVVTLDLGQHLYTVTGAVTVIDSTLNIEDGTLSAATLVINGSSLFTVADDAAFVSQTAIIGGTASAVGVVEVSGLWEGGSSIIVGNSGTGTLNIGHDGAASTGTGGEVVTLALTLGSATNGSGTVNIGDGALLRTEAATIGAGSGATGTVLVDDGGEWRNDGAMTVGALGSIGGTGFIDVADGGRLRTAQLSVGSGSLVRSDGTGAIVVGPLAAPPGGFDPRTLSRIAGGGLIVGDNGLLITNGGTVETTRAFVDGFAASSRADVTVSGAGSQLAVGGPLLVGGFRNGFLTITGGGLVDAGDVIIGEEAGGIGTVTVTGSEGGNTSELQVGGTLSVGNEGSGTLVISEGALAESSGAASVGSVSGGSGSVTVAGSGSELRVGGNLQLGFGNGAAAPLSAVSGTLQVSDGGLVVLNGGAGTLHVRSRGQLFGDGTIDGSLVLRGRLSPGTSLNALTVTGDLVTHTGSILSITYGSTALDLATVFPDLDPALVNGLLESGYVAVEGTATLADGTIVDIVKIGGGANPGDAVIIVHAQGGGFDPNFAPELDVQGSFLINWVADVLESDGAQWLRLTAELDEPGLDDFLGGLSGNLANIGQAIAEGDLFEILTQLDPAAPEAGLRTLLPLQHGAAALQSVRATQLVSRSFFREMSALRATARSAAREGRSIPRMFGSGGGDSTHLASGSSVTTADPFSLGAVSEPNVGWGGFLTGIGSWESIDTGADRPGGRARALGGTLGAHHHLTRELLVGLSAAFVRSDLTYRGGFGSGDIETFRGGPYLSWTPGEGDLFVDASVQYGTHRNELDRETILGTARSRYRAHDVSGVGRVGYEFALGEQTTLTPTGGLEYMRMRSRGHRESGAGSANLQVDGRTDHSLRLDLGASIAHRFESGGLTFIPELYAGWAREFLDDDIDIRARFGAGGPGFTTRAAGVGRDAIRVMAGFTAMSGTYITLFARYEGELQSDRTAHTAVLGLGLNF